MAEILSQDVNGRFTALMDERRCSGLSLARKSGVSDGVISKLLNGDRRPRWTTACAIAAALGVEPEILWDPQMCEGSPAYIGRRMRRCEYEGKEAC